MQNDRIGARVNFRRTLLILAALLLAGSAFFFIGRRSSPAPGAEAAHAEYADPATCNGCHQDIARTYRQTGMGRSFYRPTPESTVEDYTVHNKFFNPASDRSYTLSARDGKFYQRRHQTGFQGKETNVVEKSVDYVIGSGNHARNYVHRTPEGTFVELPVSWYSEKGGYWAMSPGYDRSGQPDFSRNISTDCMFCHNAYPAPKQRPSSAVADPVFGERVPEGIDCQRCHGPGQAHVDAAGSGKATPEAIRKTILNPARLSRDRQLEDCMQCHLETTSRDLPGAITHFDREPFSYRPGEPLGDYSSYFDHAPGPERDGKFEIAHAAYRLRKSECFLKSEMTCTTCHNPHQAYRGEEATQHYVAACKSCHAATHAAQMPARADCIGCHMPKRRAEDAVHTVLTDHYIQRNKPARDLTAPLREADFHRYDTYRGEVAAYYPPQMTSSSDGELYLAVAQVQAGANLEAGIPRLQKDLESSHPANPRFYYEIAEAYSKTGNRTEAIRWYRAALERQADFEPAIKQLAEALIVSGNPGEASSLLEKGLAAAPSDAVLLTNLGAVNLRLGNLGRAEQLLRQALAVNPDEEEAENILATLFLQKGDLGAAEKYFRDAIATEPEAPEPHFNLANLLARNGAYPESAYEFQKAIAARPDYADAHHNYGDLLVLMRSPDKAVAELTEAVRLAPGAADAHRDLADAFAATGRMDRAIAEYKQAVQLNPDFYEAHLALAAMLARSGKVAEARTHLAKAAQSPDPQVQQTAQKGLAATQ